MSNVVDAFVKGCGPSADRDVDAEALPTLVAAAVAEGAAAWPGVEVDATAFARRLGECAVAEGEAPSQGLAQLRVADLHLAMACAQRDARGCARLHEEARPGLLAAFATLGIDAGRAEDLMQDVFARLVEDRDGAPPRIATYGGRASLRRWVRAVAVRHAQAELRRKSPDLVATDLVGVVDPARSPELEALRAEYRGAFRDAFNDAVEALTVRERNLIRQSVLDGLSVDALGELYGVHRSTAARWLERAKARLQELTAAALQRRLALAPDELTDLMRLTDSRLRVSLSRVFGNSEKK